MARPGDRTYLHKKNVEREVLLARILALPEREQLRLHEALSASLGGRLGRETERARQARLRREALVAVRAAAEHLGLPEGQAPTIPEYKRAAKETSLPLTFNAVYRAFEENWDIATRFYLGQEVLRTAAQRAVQRAARRGSKQGSSKRRLRRRGRGRACPSPQAARGKGSTGIAPMRSGGLRNTPVR